MPEPTETPTRRVLVVASTFPASPTDPVPAFVRDQVIALDRLLPDTRFTVLAPHDARSRTTSTSVHESYDEHRFHYMFPRRWERLAGRGIMPEIRRSPLMLLVVPFLFLGEYRAVRRLVREERPDLLYAHWFTPQAMVCAAVGRRAGIRTVFTTHASDIAVWGRFGGLGRRLVRTAVDRSARFTAVSRRSLERARRFFTDAQWAAVLEKSAVIPMGVDLPDPAGDEGVAAFRAEQGLDDRRVVLFVGRLAAKKGVPVLLEAMPRIVREFPDVALVVAGEGPDGDAIRAQAAESGLGDAVRFAGYVSGATKDAWYRVAEMSVIPSIETADGDAEGLPVSLLEALAYGNPTVATEASVAGEVMTDGVEGRICTSGDAEALAEALADVLGRADADRAAMSTAARSTAERYGWPVIAERTSAFLFEGLPDPGRA
ncbi:glycosyltransferase [Agromyces sp. SYSU T00194]|uniref:glycosyltransferase n=1 Tax=Agromyces chitinivorans TaxID=3158560 RepID=UPI003393409F